MRTPTASLTTAFSGRTAMSAAACVSLCCFGCFNLRPAVSSPAAPAYSDNGSCTNACATAEPHPVLMVYIMLLLMKPLAWLFVFTMVCAAHSRRASSSVLSTIAVLAGRQLKHLLQRQGLQQLKERRPRRQSPQHRALHLPQRNRKTARLARRIRVQAAPCQLVA